MFFHMMCEAGGAENEAVDLESFVQGCLRLQGVASSIDLQTVAHEAKLMAALQKKFFAFVEESFTRVDATLDGLSRELSQRSANSFSKKLSQRSHKGVSGG